MTGKLTREEIAAIEHGCAMLYHRLGVAADHAFRGFVECFAKEAVWVRPSMSMRGRDEIRAFIDKESARSTRHLTRHLYSTIVIDVADRNRARGVAYAFIYRDESPANLPAPMQLPELVVSYQSEFIFEDGGWKFSRHEAEHTFSRYA